MLAMMSPQVFEGSQVSSPHQAPSKEEEKGGREAMLIPQTDIYAGLRISVIIPARNEALNLKYVLPNIPSIVSEVILVDGHSTDDTVAVAQRLLPTIRIVMQAGRGKGDAIRAGLAASTGDIIMFLDADGSADPGEIPRFVSVLLAGNDFAKGSRFIKLGGSADITLLRRCGNYGLCKFVNLLFGTKFSDLCYGYNAFWRHCFASVQLDTNGFEVETSINIRMHQAGLKIAEVPSFEHLRIHGTSNLHTFRDGWRVLWTIVSERWRKHVPPKQSTHPLPAITLQGQEASSEEMIYEKHLF